MLCRPLTASRFAVACSEDNAQLSLLPAAVTVLAADPLAEGDFYPGDLLHAVVRLPEPAWHQAASHRDRLAEVLRVTTLPAEDTDSSLRRAVALFLNRAQHP